jgi:hypothetical protein
MMTPEEIKRRHEKQMRINTALDFTKWSAERREAGKPHDHATWQTARDAVLFQQKWDNAKAHNQHLAELQEKRDAEERAIERRIDEELLPKKLRLKRQWLADNPTFTEADFESKAWVHLRQNLIEERTDAGHAAEIKRQLGRLRY